MRIRRKQNLIPRMERCSRVLIKSSAEYRGRWLEMNEGFRDLALELGCGKGSFTIKTAQENPETLFVAIEKVPDAMLIAMERACASELTNVLFLDMDAAQLAEVFAQNEVSRIYINFCDPWPSKKHAKRRLTFDGFLNIYKNILKPGGEIHFKTDNNDLYEYSVEQFKNNGLILSEVTRDLHKEGVRGIMTDYEMKFHSQGIPINSCIAKLE